MLTRQMPLNQPGTSLFHGVFRRLELLDWTTEAQSPSFSTGWSVFATRSPSLGVGISFRILTGNRMLIVFQSLHAALSYETSPMIACAAQ